MTRFRIAIPRLPAWVAWALLGSGCQSITNLPQMPSPVGKPTAISEIPPAAAQDDLPAAKAAQVCIAAAEELEQNGKPADAAVLYERARELDRGQAHLGRRLAVLYDRIGETTKARSEYLAAKERTPNDPDLLNDLGVFHLNRGELAEAETHLRAALKIAPEHRHALTNLGVVLAQQGRIEDSFEAFERVSGKAAAHSNVGVVLAQKGQTEEAARHFRQALALDPALRQPQAFLAQLEATGNELLPARLQESR